MADIPPGRWVTLSDAAHFFKVSERTIRRRISAGQLRTEHTGGRVLVLIYDTQVDKGGQADTAPATSAKVTELAAEVRRLSDLLARAEAQTDEVRGERDFLRQALAAAMSKIPAIEAGASQPAAADPEPARGESKTLSWWARFWHRGK